MAVFDSRGAANLGAQSLEIQEIVCIPAYGLDVLPGSPLPGAYIARFQVALFAQKRALWLPAEARMLSAVQRNIEQVLRNHNNSLDIGDSDV